jgi:hypothetical protein
MKDIGLDFGDGKVKRLGLKKLVKDLGYNPRISDKKKPQKVNPGL